MIVNRLRTPEAAALAILVGVWALFFWRVMTPVQADALSFAEGDFSGQFVAWAHYAAERLSAGEIPHWNPYSYGGMPFQASSQTRLTYPPHMLTLAYLAAQDSVTLQEAYAALQWEVMLHLLAASVFVWGFARALLRRAYPALPRGRLAFAALVAALTYSYSGYLTGYPILQVPLLEAGVWLPLVLWGLLRAGDGDRPAWRGVVVAGAALGVSLLAGHPQTSYFIILLALAYWGYQVHLRGWRWHVWARAVVLLGIVSGGLAAVQLIPTAEFTLYTTRAEFDFAQKASGYSFPELVGLVLPVRTGVWSALYAGVLGLGLAGVALWRRVPGAGFWGGAALLALLLSLGARAPLYGLLYPLLPGMTLFRGQERATLIIIFSLALLAGLGAAHLLAQRADRAAALRPLRWLTAGAGGLALVYYVLRSLPDAAADERFIAALWLAGTLGALLAGWGWFWHAPDAPARRAAVLGLVIIDLFGVGFMLTMNYDPRPVHERLPTPAYVAPLGDDLPPGARVAGALEGTGYGLLYRLPHIDGSDPLQLESARFWLEDLPPDRRWELLAVARVRATETPPVPAQQIAPEVWAVDDPRPFAWPVYAATLTPGRDAARGLAREPAFDLRNVVLLETNPGPLPPVAENDLPLAIPHRAEVVHFAPERIEIRAETAQPAVLTLALPYFPAWQAQLAGQDVPILRAYGGLSAVYLPGGQAHVILRYVPRSFTLGAILSVVSWMILGGTFLYHAWRSRR